MRIRYVVLAVAAFATLAACSADREDAAAASGASPSTIASETTAEQVRSLVIVGDSITNGSEVELRERLGELDVEIRAIDAEDGRRMTSDGSAASGLQAVSRLAAEAPDMWVIALGTNDVWQYAGAEVYRPAIEQLLAAVPADAPVVWVDVYLESSPELSAEFNKTLRAALRERGQAAVVDWADLADEDGVLRDGIHPSGYGNEQFAKMVTEAVSTWTR